MLREERVELSPVESRGVVLPDRVTIALLPVPEQVAEEVGGPTHAALQEREAELRELHRNACEEERPRRELARSREVPDVVEHVVRR